MRDRRTFSALVGGAVLVALLWPISSTPAPPADPPPLPSVDRLAMLQELAYWTRGIGRERLFADERPLSALANGRQRAFALFGDERGQAGRRQLLANIPYGTIIEETAERYRLDSLLLAAVVQTESGFDAAAISPRGAQGLMQLMPTTAQTYGASQPSDPHANVRAGARYLRDLLHRFDDDLELALAAYNAGPAAVRRFRGMPPYRETRGYVQRVLTLYLGYHRTLWQEARLDQLLGDLPPVGAGPAFRMTGMNQVRLPGEELIAPAAFAPRFAVTRRSAASAAGRAVVVGALAVVPAAQPLAEVADALAEPLAELRQPRGAEDQQHDGEKDQQLLDAQSEHGNLRDRQPRGFDLGLSLAGREAAPPTPAAAPVAPLAAPELRQTTAKPERASAPPS
jgi:soluble lytic murein transglycosylase-like protein